MSKTIQKITAASVGYRAVFRGRGGLGAVSGSVCKVVIGPPTSIRAVATTSFHLQESSVGKKDE